VHEYVSQGNMHQSLSLADVADYKAHAGGRSRSQGTL